MITVMSHEIIDLLAGHACSRFTLEEGAYLFRQGDDVLSLFLIEDGLVELTRHQRDGRPVVLQRARTRTLIAEASLYSDVYHCDAIARAASTIATISREDVVRLLSGDEIFSRMWAAYLAREVQEARRLIEILSRRTVAERLDGWLDWRDNEKIPRGQWKYVAMQIGVSPEALYRELARRRSK